MNDDAACQWVLGLVGVLDIYTRGGGYRGGVPLANLRPRMRIIPKLGIILKLRRVPNWDSCLKLGINRAHEDPKRPMVTYGNVWQRMAMQCMAMHRMVACCSVL